jgi:hypothetical protein
MNFEEEQLRKYFSRSLNFMWWVGLVSGIAIGAPITVAITLALKGACP